MGIKTDAALAAIQDALIEQNGELKQHAERLDQLEKIVQAQARDIASLEGSVQNLRDQSIKSAVSRGVPTKIVAQAHGLSPGRVSQIAPASPTNIEQRGNENGHKSRIRCP
jgi:chromosome segregation ATPase